MTRSGGGDVLVAIDVELDEDTIEDIDELAREHGFPTRSSVVEAALEG